MATADMRIAELEAALRAVCEQRDRAWSKLDDCISAFWSAHYNHAFDNEDEEENTKKLDENGKPTTYRCSAGRSLRDCFHGCNIFDDEEAGCKGYDCPMGFHHRNLYEKIDAATEEIQSRKAERNPFDLSRIPEYDSRATYHVKSCWFAKMLLCFFTEYRCGKKYTEERCKEFGDAYLRLVRIGLANYGVKIPDDAFTKEGKDKYGEGTEAGNALMDQMKGFVGTYGWKYIDSKDMELEGEALVKRMVDDEAFRMYWLIAEAMTWLGEFAFDHDYPGADLGVYQDRIGYLKWVCSHIIGCDNDFDVVMAMNDTSNDGLSTTRQEQN